MICIEIDEMHYSSCNLKDTPFTRPARQLGKMTHLIPLKNICMPCQPYSSQLFLLRMCITSDEVQF